VYGQGLAGVYDQIYRDRGKDYAAEAADVLDLIRARRGGVPGSLLDVACGTGGHLRHFATLAGHVEGLELSDEMIKVAAAEVPGVRINQGDMREFDLGRRFAALSCMFSSIAYLGSATELDRTLARFAAHLEPGGVAVVEPWWFPDDFISGYVSTHTSVENGRTICRTSHSVRDGGFCAMEVHVVVADAGGIRHFVDEHRMALFVREEYETAFARAGLAVEFLPGGPSGRGLFVGVAPR